MSLNPQSQNLRPRTSGGEAVSSGLSDGATTVAAETGPEVVADNNSRPLPKIKIQQLREVPEVSPNRNFDLEKCQFGIFADRVFKHSLLFEVPPGGACEVSAYDDPKQPLLQADQSIEKSVQLLGEQRDPRLDRPRYSESYCEALRQSNPELYKRIMMDALKDSVRETEEIFKALKISPVG